eukprot:2161451-Heterocapsa_arctica.AAC.1
MSGTPPDEAKAFPPALAGVPRAEVADRDAAWWRSSGAPQQNALQRLSGSEGGTRGRGVAVG